MKTVLIVDDNALVLDAIDLLLSRGRNFRSIRALGVASALSDLEQARIDVLVADVILAGSTTGIELCQQAIERHPTIAIVVITADNEVRREEIPERGIFLRKPFGGKQLLQAIDAALERTGEKRRRATARS
ncbi:MAG: response regulator [Rhodanobacter sp.]